MTAPTLTVISDTAQRRAVLICAATVGASITLYRTSALGSGAVRGAVDNVMATAEKLFADYELPQGVPVSYFVTQDDGAVITSSSIVDAGTFDFGGDVIFDLARPEQGLLVNVESLPASDYDVARDVVAVWDRPDPVVVSGERRLPSGTLTLITLDDSGRVRLSDALLSGNIIAFSPWKPEYGLPSPMYLSVGKVTAARTSARVLEPSRRWAMEVQQVNAPRSSYVYPTGSRTWQDVVDSGDWSGLLPESWFDVAGF
jgi:hypothetical protein